MAFEHDARIEINDEILYYEWNDEHERRQQQKQKVLLYLVACCTLIRTSCVPGSNVIYDYDLDGTNEGFTK